MKTFHILAIKKAVAALERYEEDIYDYQKEVSMWRNYFLLTNEKLLEEFSSDATGIAGHFHATTPREMRCLGPDRVLQRLREAAQRKNEENQ